MSISFHLKAPAFHRVFAVARFQTPLRRCCCFRATSLAAVIQGDTVGDPLKDTSGPALNIVMKLMAIISLVFAPAFPSPEKGGLFVQLFS